MRVRLSACLLVLAVATNTAWSGELPSTLPKSLNDVVETVIERDAAGVIRKERQVTLDAELNFVNHGSYREFDESGQVVKSGHYKMGRRHGEWKYYFSEREAGSPLMANAATEFKAPFVAQGTFDEDVVNGEWSIQDAEGRPVFDAHSEDGVCHGIATWWHATGEKRVVIPFENGIAVGETKYFDREGELIQAIENVTGRPLLTKVGQHKSGEKAYEGTYLGSVIVAPKYTWWTGEATEQVSRQEKNDETLQRHGSWVTYYPSGARESAGHFIQGQPHGDYEWWYPTGQRRISGHFEQGQPSGRWIKWHPNGMRRSMVAYKNGVVAGEWMRWDEQGRLHEFAINDEAKKAEQAGPNLLVPESDELTEESLLDTELP